MQRNHLKGLLKHILVTTLRVFDLVVLGWGPRICISIRFPGDVDAASLGIPLWEPAAGGSSSSPLLWTKTLKHKHLLWPGGKHNYETWWCEDVVAGAVAAILWQWVKKPRDHWKPGWSPDIRGCWHSHIWNWQPLGMSSCRMDYNSY